MHLYRPILCLLAPLCAVLPVAAAPAVSPLIEAAAGTPLNSNRTAAAQHMVTSTSVLSGIPVTVRAAVFRPATSSRVYAAPVAAITDAAMLPEGAGPTGTPPHRAARTLYRKGLRLQREGRLDEAQACFEAALASDAAFTDAGLALAAVYRQQHQPELAKQRLSDILKTAPGCGEALAALAEVHYEQRAWEDAMACAWRALEWGRPGMYRIIGLGYSWLDRPHEAAAALEKAWQERSLNGEELCRAARICAQLEAFGKSVEYYEAALKAGGHPPAIYYELGMMYFNMKNYQSAAGAFEHAARLGRPADADLYLNLGMAHLKQAACEEAITHLQTALRLRPKDIQAMLLLANAYYKKQDFQQAAAQWNKILALQPQNAFAMFMLGKSYMGSGEVLKGQAICDQALLLGEK